MVVGALQLSSAALAAGNTFLREHQQPGGGWSYGAAQFCYAEPTALALLALEYGNARGSAGRDDLDSYSTVRDGLSWLQGQVNQAGFITLPGDPDNPHWSTALAVFAAARLGQPDATWRPGARFLLDWQAIATEPDPAIPLDTTLRGWPWYPESFSWVIPTAYAILALRIAGYGAHIRVTEGVAMVLDRMCEGGGWNYGNREVLGQLLQPMAETTAWALLALQGCPAAHDAAALGLDVLYHEVRRRPSGLSLALAILCLDLYGHSADDLVPLLVERQMDDGSWQHQVHLSALAMLALKAILGVGNVFALQA